MNITKDSKDEKEKKEITEKKISNENKIEKENTENTESNDIIKIKNNENNSNEKKDDKNNDNEKNENKIIENEINDNEINEEYNYEEEDYDINDDNDNADNVQLGQEEVLENMFLNAKNSENDNKIDLFSDIISLDESKEKIWSYKCYQEICLIYLQFEDHLMFPLYYKQLMNAERTFDPKKLRPYIEQTVDVFLNEIKTHYKESINHWLEDLTSDFNRTEQDKVINTFEANINLKFLLLSKNGDINNKSSEQEEYDDNNNTNNNIDINIIEYLEDKNKLEELTNDYLIKECGCNPEYLDKKGNTFFYFQLEDNKRVGEKYNVSLGWTAFGIEVTNRYGNNTDWIACDGRNEEWAIAYHGFGCRMSPDQIKKIIKTIIHDNLKPGAGQACSGSRDRRHPGNLCKNGVYVTPNLNIATQYAGSIQLGGKAYRIVIMVRVNPKFIREPEHQPDFWILDGNPNQLRPYRLLIKEANSIQYRY